MFNDKPYFEVNREERFYCALLSHALLSSLVVRERFTELIYSKFGITLRPDDFQVFLEAATLRDFWNDPGDPKAYTEETHIKRRKIICSLLSIMNISEEAIDKYIFFWTSEKQKKLWSPGRWEPKALKEAGLYELIKLRWAFNAKPDIMILSNSNALIIEVKVESGEGNIEDTGYRQLDIQVLISQLLNRFVPYFKEVNFKNTILSLNTKEGITWKEILTLIEDDKLDDFSQQCLYQLKRFYK